MITAVLSPKSEIWRIGEAVAAAGGRPVLVGGWVRDDLLGHPHSKDFDLEVFGLAPNKLRRVLSDFGPVHAVGKQFGVLKLTTREAEYDVSLPRREVNTGAGHKGFWVRTDPAMGFEEAASRRDFTINAMGYAFLEGQFLDPFDGQTDLRARLLRHVGPAFGEDPLRVLRAMQFAGRFGLTIHPETIAVCRNLNLAELPRERLWGEFQKLLLEAPQPSVGLSYAEPLGILPYFPELERLFAAPAPRPEAHTPWQGTLATVDEAARLKSGNSAPDTVLMLGALCHTLAEFAPPATPPPADPTGNGPEGNHRAGSGPVEDFLRRLTHESALLQGVQNLVRELPQPDALHADRGKHAASAIRRLALRISIPFLERLARARHHAAAGGSRGKTDYPAGEWLLDEARRLGVLEGPPEPLLKGRHLTERGYPPGKAMGKILDEAFELQLDGGIGCLEEALKWLARTHPAAPARPGEPAR